MPIMLFCQTALVQTVTLISCSLHPLLLTFSYHLGSDIKKAQKICADLQFEGTRMLPRGNKLSIYLSLDI